MSFYVRMDAELRRRGRVRAAHARHLATLLNRSRLLLRAWAIARTAAARFGGTVVSFIAGSLRLAWSERRAFLAELA